MDRHDLLGRLLEDLVADQDAMKRGEVRVTVRTEAGGETDITARRMEQEEVLITSLQRVLAGGSLKPN